MIGVLVTTAILWMILAIVARNPDGETSYSTLFYVSLGVTFTSFVVSFCQPGLVIFVMPVICAFAVWKFCYVGWTRSIIASVLYTGAMIGWGFLLQSLKSSLTS